MQTDLFDEDVPLVPFIEPDEWFDLYCWVSQNPEVKSPMCDLAVEYKHEDTTDRRRGKIYLMFIERFENLVKQKVGLFVKNTRSTTKTDYFDEGMAIWTRMVGEKLNQWDGRGDKHPYLNILAYLFPFASRGVASELNEKHAYKDMRYSTTDATDGSGDALNCIVNTGGDFEAYETSLMASAFEFIGTSEDEGNFNCLTAICDEHTARESVEEISGSYTARNANQWSVMHDSNKINKVKDIEYLGVKFTPVANVGKTISGGYDE